MRSILVVVTVAALGGTAAARPPAATRALLARLADGSVPVVSLVDPSKGVWLFDLDSRTQACGAGALLDVAVEVQVHARTWGADAACVNRAHDATCTLPGTDDGWGHYELRFDRTPGRLVLRALVRAPLRDGASTAVPGAICRDSSLPPAAPPPIAATARRDAPDGTLAPTVATQAMLRHLAAGDWPLADLIDRERGLVIVDHPPDASDAPAPGRDARVCGGAIARELSALQTRMALIVAEVDRADGSMSCANHDGGADCTMSIMGEWGDVMRFHFRQTERGLVLDAFGDFDEHQVPEHELEQEDIEYEQALAHAWATPCPQTP